MVKYVLQVVDTGVGLSGRFLLGAAMLALAVSACGDASTEHSPRAQAAPSEVASAATGSPSTGASHSRVCPPESPYVVTDATNDVKRLLRAYGYQPNGEIAHAGQVTVATGLTLNSADGHEQNAFFIANGRVVATDMSSGRQGYHFTAVICQAGAGQIVTAYQVNAGPMGHAPGCPPLRTARVRWRIDGQHVTRLDPLPKPPCG